MYHLEGLVKFPCPEQRRGETEMKWEGAVVDDVRKIFGVEKEAEEVREKVESE